MFCFNTKIIAMSLHTAARIGKTFYDICLKLRRLVMQKLLLIFWRFGKSDLRQLLFALRHPDRPLWLLPATIGLLLYALSPLNVAIPMVGVVDEVVLVPMVLHFLLKLLPRHLQQSGMAHR
jgi:uncharacterized membrane protein YkvA (DUF1232 family)